MYSSHVAEEGRRGHTVVSLVIEIQVLQHIGNCNWLIMCNASCVTLYLGDKVRTGDGGEIRNTVPVWRLAA